jgi:propanediol dehydratase small subunit
MAQMNEQLVAEVVRQVLQAMNGKAAPAPASASKEGKLTAADYPLASKRPDILKSPKGTPFNELTLEAVENGKATFEDFRITPEALEMQAQIAESAGRRQIAQNLRRAAELTKVPDERILEIYNLLRPHRSTKEELEGIAEELETKYGAKVCAAFVRESAEVYARRKLLRGDLPSSD